MSKRTGLLCAIVYLTEITSTINLLKVKCKPRKMLICICIWEKKEIENYLLIPEAIFRIIDKPNAEYDGFRAKLEALIDGQKDEVVLQFANQLQIQDSKRKDLGSYVKSARKYVEQSWGTLERKLSIIGGKYALSLINSWIKSNHHKHCSQATILSAIKAEDISSEMVEVIRALCT